MTMFNDCGHADADKKKPQWIWFPGDFSIRLHQDTCLKRQERNEVYLPLWRIDTHNPVVLFRRPYQLEQPEQATLLFEGVCQVRLDGVTISNINKTDFTIPAGEHVLECQVTNFDHVPSIWFKTESFVSDGAWIVSNQDKAWYAPGRSDFTDAEKPPSSFKLKTVPMKAQAIQKTSTGLLVDFGKETIGYPLLEGCCGRGEIGLFYGESKAEALAEKQAETYEFIKVDSSQPTKVSIPTSRAYRYVNVVIPPTVTVNHVSMLYEYLPLKCRGSFSCSDEVMNKIYEVSYYTLQLNTREFHVDGIKRDRWLWSGDAYQSYLMNFYTFFDEPVNRRTLHALRGQDPVKTHVNTILDYSFYWIMGIYEHYWYTGDQAFVKEIYPKMQGLMAFCLSRTNRDGMVEGFPGDWVFVDWAPMGKEGELCFEQLLWARSLECMAACAQLVGHASDSEKYRGFFKALIEKIDEVFWDEEKQAYIHGRKAGKLLSDIYEYPNMFAILLGYASAEKKACIQKNVLDNQDIQEITTPYMRFYELAALCEIDEHETVTEFVKAYWGGMLKLGATSFWEAYDPNEDPTNHYAMYDRPFGKSLCHAWGANPVYLFGKYYLGVEPTSPGYETYRVRPNRGGLEWIEGKVPAPQGDIFVKMSAKTVEIFTPLPGGTLVLREDMEPQAGEYPWDRLENGDWQLKLKPNLHYQVQIKIP